MRPKVFWSGRPGSYRGASYGAGSFDVPRSGEAGCTLPCTNLSVAQLHCSLGSPCFQPDWLVGWLTGLLTHLVDCIRYVPAERSASTLGKVNFNRSSRRSWITLCCHGSTSYTQYKCSVQAIINMLFRVNISPEFIWIQVLLQSVGFHFFLTSPAISFISCQAARREKMRSRRLFSAQSLWKCAIGNFSVWLLPNGICFLCSCTKPLKRDHVF